MRKNTTYNLPAYIQLKKLLILILKNFLGIIILTFIPSAIGATKPSAQKIRESLFDRTQEPSHTDDLADMALSPSSVLPLETSTDSVLNNPDISAPPNEQASTIIPNWGQETKRGFPKETLNKVQDTVKYLIANEKNEKIKDVMESLWLQLERQILSGSLIIPEVIDLLREEIFKDERDPYQIKATITVTGELLIKYPLHDTLKISQTIDSLRDIIFKNTFLRVAAIELIEKLLIKYPLSQPEVLKTLNLLQIELSLKQTNTFIRTALIQCIGKVLGQYNLPEKEKLKVLNQIKEFLFHRDFHIRTADQDWDLRKQAIITLSDLLSQQDILSDPENRRDIALTIADRISKDENWGVRKQALITLDALLNQQSIISDPEDRKDIALTIAERISKDEDWRVRKEAVIISGALLQQQIVLFDPEDRRDIALKIAERMTEDEDWRERKLVIITLGALLNQQGIISDPEDRKNIALTIADRISKDENWGVRKQALITLDALLNQQGIISDPEDRRDIALTIAERISKDEDWRVRKEAVIISGALLQQQIVLFDPEDRRDIALKIAERMTEDEDSGVQKQALITSESLLNQQGIISDPEDRRDIARIITTQIFDTNHYLRSTGAKMINKLWISDLPLPEKLNIIQTLSQKISTETTGISTALNVLRQANQAGLPLDFDMIYKITDMASEPSALGKTAKNLVREYLNTQSLSDDPDTDASLRLTLHLKLEKQLPKKSQLAQEQEQPDETKITACQKSILPSNNTPPDAS